MNIVPHAMIAAAVVLIAGGCGSDSDVATSVVAGDGSTIEVEAHSYGFDPEEIHLAAGDAVTIRLTARGAHHDFVVDEADFALAADQGETDEGTLTAPAPGDYAFYCSIPGHRSAGMEGVLVVDP